MELKPYMNPIPDEWLPYVRKLEKDREKYQKLQRSVRRLLVNFVKGLDDTSYSGYENGVGDSLDRHFKSVCKQVGVPFE